MDEPIESQNPFHKEEAAKEQKLFSKLMEVYAAFSTYTDDR